jgi:hypothetical protein
MRPIELTIRGTSPLLMHNVRMANPLDKYSKDMARLNKAKKVKGADKDQLAEEMARVEWEGGLYHSSTDLGNDDGMGPYLPARNIHKAVLEAARMSREGQGVEQGVYTGATKFRLEYAGPRGVQELYDAGFVDQRMVVVGQAKVLRSRPAFPTWQATVKFMVQPDVCDLDRFVEFVRTAGLYKGVCDGHKGIMGMGRFEVLTS